MCRLIMALGKFSIDKIITSAVAMSQGKTAGPDAPIKFHVNGWGAIWQDKNSPLGLYTDMTAQLWKIMPRNCCKVLILAF